MKMHYIHRTYLFSLWERLKADNTIRVNQIVTISLIESSIHILDQNRYPVDTSLIHLESRKSPTAELFNVDSGRISIVTMNTKEYHSDDLALDNIPPDLTLLLFSIIPRTSTLSNEVFLGRSLRFWLDHETKIPNLNRLITP
ncbi:hypothetical protein Tco_0656020 [Tanacetum coccineum]|uniref:Uncharacterized protein n=1 Tax=Tanacetum coccineum TaxID=301880 RepID=A0ABQ4X7S6_9ASTR